MTEITFHVNTQDKVGYACRLLRKAWGAGSKVAESLWKDVLWPRIRRRLGVRALGAQRTAENATEREG